MSEPESSPIRRLPGQTLRHVWSPKCARPLLLTSLSQLRLWIMLESNPEVSVLRERPLSSDLSNQRYDYWAMRSGEPVWLAISEDTQANAHAPNVDRQDLSCGDIDRTELITRTDLDRHRVWIQNWLSLLPYLCTGSALSMQVLRERVLNFYQYDGTLEDAEHEFGRTDPVLIRTAVIAELHAGGLTCEDLSKRTWDRSVRISSSRGTSDAP